ncbi:MAG: acyltransferase domain-containing protein [bacterium]|nr:acyltransferase domain-containing protein [bacterium]
MISETIPPGLVPILKDTPLGGDWRESARSSPEKLPFLEAPFVQEYGTWASLPQEAIAFLVEAAHACAADPDIKLLAWHAHRLLFGSEAAEQRGATRDWPLLAPVMGKFGGAFYLLIVLSGMPGIRAFHRARHVPDDIARLTYRDTYVWAKQYYDIGAFVHDRFTHPDEPHCWGLCTRILPWLMSHLAGDLFRIGRLQFKTGAFRQQLRAYRHRKTGQMRLIAEPGLAFRRDGNFDGAGGIVDAHAWTSGLNESGTEVSGHLIHPDGHAVREVTALPLSTWECVLTQGEPILEIHIPEDGPMDFDACGSALRQAAAFFPDHFPDRPFKAICCTSWLLDPTYQDLLSPGSNIVRFQKASYLFPLHSRGARSGLERIFGPYTHDLATAPRDSSMRRAVLDHITNGGVLISGGCLLWTEHLAHWDREIYRLPFGPRWPAGGSTFAHTPIQEHTDV